ncbi:MAG TPA: APC family permease [Gemmatimonadales bacterium]|nr:APC family permease [Gemmatimonadales bacterium]
MTNPPMVRRFGLLHATALNMTNMMGIGPFITIPLLMSALGGPQAMLGWAVALIIVVCDGMVWSELGAALPGSGGSFGYLRYGYGAQTVGRLMAFLFVWQFVLSGPLEIASGYIGFAKYLGYIWKSSNSWQMMLVIAAIGIVNIVLLYRRITSIATITLTLWVGTIVTVLVVIVTGAMHFDPKVAFDFPPGAFNLSPQFLRGLGAASAIGVYDYLGYYDVCYIGDEVQNPGRVIPRSILLSTVCVALIYIAINFSIIGVVPWRDFVPADTHPQANFVVSIFMERIYGSGIATVFTAMVLWTAFGSVFALLLGYSRVPYAAARDGYFFRIFARVHAVGGFPYVSLVVLGVLSILAGFVSLDTVIFALVTLRILVQFVGQIGAVTLLRRREPDMARPYRMWLYPLPSLVALLGWIFIFATTPATIVGWAFGALLLGLACFAIWSWKRGTWPFASSETAPGR